MSYKELYENVKCIIENDINNEFINVSVNSKENIVNTLKEISNSYKGKFYIYNLKYKLDLYETYIIDFNDLKFGFVFTIYEENNEYKIKVTPLDYEYLIDISDFNYDKLSYLIDVFYGSMLNCFSNVAMNTEQFNYEFILLKKFNRNIIDENIYIKDIKDIYNYLNIFKN